MTGATELTTPRDLRGRAGDREFQLVAIGGPAGTLVVDLDASSPARVLLGQSPLCDVRIADGAISRRHAAIELRGTHLTITDLGSTNGTFVNGVAVLAAELRGGEVVRIGDTKLRVLAVPASEPKRRVVAAEIRFGKVVGASVEMRRVLTIARRLAATDAPVLVEGEAGTGKRLLAEAIHEAGPRAAEPFLVLGTVGVDPARIQTLLFGSGHGELGLLELADGGTLVIDEVASLDAASQTRLRTALEHREIRRKDGAATPIDTRVIACARRNLDRDVEDGRFREDLLLRLAAGRVELPPLRRRDGDLSLLIETLWTSLGGSADAVPAHLAHDLADQAWPGNVRELESVLVRYLVSREEPAASAQHAFERVAGDPIDAVLGLDLALPQARARVVDAFERRYLARALAMHEGNVVRAAAASGVARRYFQLLRARQQRDC